MPICSYQVYVNQSSDWKAVKKGTDKQAETIILSRVYGSVTNNNGVLDWMIGFINTFLYNHSESQSITITHSQSSAEPSFLDCQGLAPFSFWFHSVLYYVYSLEVDP
jgi:hypothetical protein